MSDAGKVVEMKDGRRYLILDGSLHEGSFKAQHISPFGQGQRASVEDGAVYSAFGLTGPLDGDEVWLDGRQLTLSASEVASVSDYLPPGAEDESPAVTVTAGPRSRPSSLAERQARAPSLATR